MRYEGGKEYYTVGEVAKAVGVSVQTVRNWAGEGRLAGIRSAGGHRLFDVDGVQRAREYAARRRRAGSESSAPAAGGPDSPGSSDGSAAAERAGAGAMLRAARERSGLSQQDVADRAGISRSMMSALERGRTGASIAVVSRIADALGVAMAEMAPVTEGSLLTCRGDRLRTVIGDGVVWEELGPPGHTIAPAVLSMPAGASSGDVAFSRENFVLVLSGRLEFTVLDSGRSHVLGPGDSLFILPGQRMRWESIDGQVAEAVWVETLRSG